MSPITTFLRMCKRNVLYTRRPICAYTALCTCVVLLYIQTRNCNKPRDKNDGRTQRNVNAYVVEEHHEVVEHWIQETRIRSINTTGNTLIHVDAHSDMATPDLIPGFPTFRWPKDNDDMHHMMQRNDVFIVGSIIIGLFDHVIWIFPSWDKFIAPDYEVILLEVGYTDEDSSDRSSFCECRTPYNEQGQKLSREVECTRSIMSGPDYGDEDEIPRNECHVERSAIFEVVVDHVAMDMMARGAWFKTPTSVIFDIDEDFFGCESGFDGLETAGFDVKTAHHFSEKVSDLICPENTDHEDSADKLLKRHIAHFIDQCQITKPGEHCPRLPPNLQVMNQNILEYFRSNPDMFCEEKSPAMLRTLGELHHLLLELNLGQLRAILDLGFCMGTSPATLSFQEHGSDFILCHGYNIPNETVVNLYTPPQEELSRRMKDAHEMFSQILDLDVRAVTICRSVRDGYAPRKLANFIEDNILLFFGQHHDSYLFHEVFNTNLLGGKRGWQGRSLY